MIKIGIIGSAGGKGEKFTKELFDKMCKKGNELIKGIKEVNKVVGTTTDITLMSGGAAWSDHVAINIGSEYKSVEIYFPCGFDVKENKHEDNGKWDWKENPGRLSNSLHEQFGKELGRNTQEDFGKLKNIIMYKGNGFHHRNTYVAACHYLIAFTFSESMDGYKGGTADTWKKCKGIKLHVNLNKL